MKQIENANLKIWIFNIKSEKNYIRRIFFEMQFSERMPRIIKDLIHRAVIITYLHSIKSV